MKNIKKIGLVLVILVGYLFVINIFANLMYSSNEISQPNKNGDADLTIGLGEYVSVEVIRVPHWYGRFIINDGREYLNLFFFYKIPWVVKKINFVWFHLIFIIFIILFTILIFIKQNDCKEVKEHEELAKSIDNFGNIVPGIYN